MKKEDIINIVTYLKLGKLYNKLNYHRDRLGIRKDQGHTYEMAEKIVESPEKYKEILSKLKKYELLNR